MEGFACEAPGFHGMMGDGAVGHREVEQELRCELRGVTKQRDSSACAFPLGKLLQSPRAAAAGGAQPLPSPGKH